jgi:hypothetical protein
MNFHKYIFIFSLLICLQTNGNAQNLKFAERALIGTSFTYITNYEEDNFFIARYDQWVWDKSIAISLNHSFYFGLTFKNIYGRGSSYDEFSTYSENSYAVGAFLQYDILPKQRQRFFFETAWQYGNYCTCGWGDPYEKGGLHYVSLGFGGTVPLNNWLSFEGAMNFHSIVNERPIEHGFNIYRLGLLLDFSNRKDYMFGQKRG